MKRFAAFFFCIVLLLALSQPVFGAVTHTPDMDVACEYAYLFNMDTGKVIYEKNPDDKCYPASLVKIMTCILALENTPDPDREMVIYPNYVQDYLYTYQLTYGSISLAGMLAGEEMTMRELLYGLMLRSGNEVAMIIADHISGSQEAFVELMNARAKQLGATNTNFTNANGLFDPQQMTTARDMALITRHAMSLPGFMEVATTPSYVAGPTNKNERLEWNTTVLMQVPTSSYYYPHLRGIKTGTLPESGRCFVSSATRDGFTYLLVLMGGPYLDSNGDVLEGNSAFEDAKNIYDWVFDTFKVKSLVEKNKIATTVPLNLNMDVDVLQLVTAERFTALVPKDVDPATSVTMLYDIPDSVDAPVKKGDRIGTAKLMLFGEEVGTVELLSNQTVEASRLLILLEQVKAVLRSFWFKFAVIFLVLLIILYIILMIVRNKNKQRRKVYKPRRRL